MTNPEKPISEIVDGLDLLSKPFAEHEINGAINSYIKEKNKNEIPPKWLAESIAFRFMQDYQDKETSWGTYYGPMMVWNNEDGTSAESPSIKLVTPEILNYWEERSRKAENPILKLRYADLVWDFTNIIKEESPCFTIAHTIADNTAVIAIQNCHKYETDVIKKLERALFVALSINDSERIEKMRDSIIQYETDISEDKKPGLWGFSFDLLLKSKKIKISDETKQKIIQDLENRLTKLSDTADKNNLEPWAAEAAALRLAEYYRSTNQKESIERVLLKFGTAFKVASEDASALQASSWLQRVHSVYLDYRMREEAEKIIIRLKEIGPKTHEEMKTISHEMKISHDEMQGYISSIIDNDLETTFVRIAIHYIPKKDQVENQLKNLAKEAPISYLVPRQIQDHQGRPIAVIGSLEDDMIGNIVHLSSQNMSMSAVFLRCVIEELVANPN
jgi:hypothetical protein